MNSEQILFLSATVKTERGRKILRRGDTLPADTLEGEADRLRGMGALGVPAAPEPAPAADEADVLAGAMAEEIAEEDGVGIAAYVEAAKAPEIISRAEAEPDLAPALLDAENARKKPRSTVVAALTEMVEGSAPEPDATPEPAPAADEADGTTQE